MCGIAASFNPIFNRFDLTTMNPNVTLLPRLILLAAVLNLAIAPMVYAASDGNITRGTAYALGLLGLVVLGLATYLTIVILYPERF